mmetsp:Transcript_17346/g.59326  ORF Transcript_17346/g.59326 Transcript_17346/m.59326 type:complete len:203 (-) Transcript_17346:61-669(-)
MSWSIAMTPASFAAGSELSTSERMQSYREFMYRAKASVDCSRASASTCVRRALWARAARAAATPPLVAGRGSCQPPEATWVATPGGTTEARRPPPPPPSGPKKARWPCRSPPVASTSRAVCTSSDSSCCSDSAWAAPLLAEVALGCVFGRRSGAMAPGSPGPGGQPPSERARPRAGGRCPWAGPLERPRWCYLPSPAAGNSA